MYYPIPLFQIAGIPATTQKPGIAFVTTELVPITAYSSMVTPAMILTPLSTNVFLPISVPWTISYLFTDIAMFS
jgi:hypothetical protein